MRSLQDHFLIAMPAMADPNFTETVTYICKHDAEGAYGIIINRPGNLSLAEMLGQLAMKVEDRGHADTQVLVGGPVEPERGFVLHRSGQTYESTAATGGDISVTVSLDVLTAIARGEGPDPMLVVLGYAGWGRGQLDAEIEHNSWLTVPADPTIVFDTPFEQRWATALGLPGVDIRRITNYAGHA
jgi:putative transcriptional regulator